MASQSFTVLTLPPLGIITYPSALDVFLLCDRKFSAHIGHGPEAFFEMTMDRS